ncbi:short chain dehydrogenase reductase [Xylaria longipes]|nr:short chain dehydrogenase reductase [Xylaria longipes]
MATINIDSNSLPSMEGKMALVTGGSAGIGLGAAKIMALKGATVFLLDLNEPTEPSLPSGLHFRKCDVTQWRDLASVFDDIPRIDYVFANAGAAEEADYFEDTFGPDGALQEPAYGVFDINLRAVVNMVKLAWRHMRDKGVQGSIVITTSATAYAPEQSLPVFCGTKFALVGLVRALRSVVIRDGITINAVAPAATLTQLLPAHLAAPILAMGLPVSTSEFVGRALVYSATATQERLVEVYGKQEETQLWTGGRWNGRVILTLGDTYTELEEAISDLRPFWFGRENLRLTRIQQAATDFAHSQPSEAQS